MKIVIDGEPKEIAQLLSGLTKQETTTEVKLQLPMLQWKHQQELIEKIVADCNKNYNLRISGRAM